MISTKNDNKLAEVGVKYFSDKTKSIRNKVKIRASNWN